MSGFQSPITIAEAMKRIDNNNFLLPAFQRDFVWKTNQIEMLFDSLMRNYPISSFLFWKVTGEAKTNGKFYEFLKHYITGARDKSVDNVLHDTSRQNDFFAVLDGQQRLTAIRIGIYGSYAYHEKGKSYDYSERSFPTRSLYLNVSRQGGIDDSFVYEFKFKKDSDTNKLRVYIDGDTGYKWLKVSEIDPLYASGDEIGDYFNEVVFERNERQIINRLKKVIFTDLIITYYEEDDPTPDKAVKIFTRINSGGTFLSFSNIVFSQIVSNWANKNAKEEINDLIDDIQTKGFEIDLDYIVKSFLFLYHKSIKTEISSFNVVFCNLIESNWDNISACIKSLFDLLRSFGLNSFNLTSKNATIPILYYLYHKNIYSDFVNKVAYEKDRKDIKKWLLAVLLKRAFGSSTDGVLSQIRKAFTADITASYLDPKKNFEDLKLDSFIKGYGIVDEEVLEELLATQKDDKYAFAILSLLYPNLDYKNNNFHKDHLHADKLYINLSDELKQKYPFKSYNSIVNLQMLDKNENESKSKKPLKQWVEEECEENGYDPKKFLKDHSIPDVNLELENFDEFYTKRKELLKKELRKLLNVSSLVIATPTDDDVEE